VPGLADKGAAREASGGVLLDAEEDVLDELDHQLRWLAWPRWCHGVLVGGGAMRDEARVWVGNGTLFPVAGSTGMKTIIEGSQGP
jgi:hypothetical protein